MSLVEFIVASDIREFAFRGSVLANTASHQLTLHHPKAIFPFTN